MRIFYGLAAVPALVVLYATIAMALGASSSASSDPTLIPGTDLGRARRSLMALIPVSTPTDAAVLRLTSQGLSCAVSEPPLANLTWPVVQCSTKPSLSGAILSIDVAARNGVVADIGVEDLACSSRADIVDPDPEPGGCNLSGHRLLDLEAKQRKAESALVDALLGPRGPAGRPHP